MKSLFNYDGQETVCEATAPLLKENAPPPGKKKEPLSENSDGYEAAEQQKSPDEASSKKRLDLVENLITFRDQLLYFRDEFSAARNDGAVKLLSNLYKESGRFMQENGIETLDKAGGVFSEDYQSVTGTTDTTDPAQEDIVAETFRPGYRIDGSLHRMQEVIIYTLVQEEKQ